MANAEHLARLEKGVSGWNAWRRMTEQDPPSAIDLSSANLTGADLSAADLTRANLSGADLSHADLSHADLSRASLCPTRLWSPTNLSRADVDEPYERYTD